MAIPKVAGTSRSSRPRVQGHDGYPDRGCSRALSREREHLGRSQSRLGQRLVEHNLHLRAQRLAAWMDEGMIPRRDPNALAEVILHALTGFHMSEAFFGRPPGASGEQQVVATLVALIVGD